jgi:polyphosphate kinase
VSENIRVRSIVGRFLEHHRIFCFHADGQQVTICGSADWMPRNLFRRVEVSFPIESKKLRARVIEEGLQVLLEDNCQAWEMQSDGSYVRLTSDLDRPGSAQQRLLESLARLPGE